MAKAETKDRIAIYLAIRLYGYYSLRNCLEEFAAVDLSRAIVGLETPKAAATWF